MSAPNDVLLEPVVREAEASKHGKAALFLSALIGFGAGMCLMSQAPVKSDVELIAMPGALQVSKPLLGSTALAPPAPLASSLTDFSRISSFDRVVPSGLRRAPKGARRNKKYVKDTYMIRHYENKFEEKPAPAPEIAEALKEEGYNGHKVMYDGYKKSTLQIAYRMWVEANRDELKEEWKQLTEKEARVKFGMVTPRQLKGFWLGSTWLSRQWKALDREAKEPYMRKAAALKAAAPGTKHTAEEYLAQYGFGNMTRQELKEKANMKPLFWSVTRIEKERALLAQKLKWKQINEDKIRAQRQVFR